MPISDDVRWVEREIQKPKAVEFMEHRDHESATFWSESNVAPGRASQGLPFGIRRPSLEIVVRTFLDCQRDGVEVKEAFG